MGKILLVEDAVDCQILIRQTLDGVAEVRVAGTLAEARTALRDDRFDLMILDLNLPDGNGLDLFTQMRSPPGGAGEGLGASELAVVFLTGELEAQQQVTAFSLGADDYLHKPVRPLEFRARVDAKLRKIAGTQGAEAALVRGDMRLELGTQRVYVGAGAARQQLELTGREFKLLYHLARHEGVVFTREQLIEAVWGGAVHVLGRTVDTHVYTLRKKLGTNARVVESAVGRGYVFKSGGRGGAT